MTLCKALSVPLTLPTRWGLIFAAFLTSLATLLLTAKAHPVSSTCTEAEVEIYRSILDAKRAGIQSIVIEEETRSPHVSINLGDFIEREAVASLAPRLLAAPRNTVAIFAAPLPTTLVLPREKIRELNQHFQESNRSSCEIKMSTTEEGGIKFLSDKALDKLFSGSSAASGWRRLQKTYGDDTRLISFSRVAFDDQRRLAIVHVNSGIGEMAGHGCLYVFGFAAGKWTVLRLYTIWVT